MSNLLRQVDAVVFDLDDTLFPEWQFAYSGFDAVADRLSSRFHPPFDLAVRMRQLFHSGDRGRVFNVILDELGQGCDPEFLENLIDLYRNHAPRISLHPDADDALTRLRSSHVLGCISDGPLTMQSNKLTALDLRPRLDEIILTDQWGRPFWKPHPRAFEEMSRRIGVPAQRCLYVADNPAKDFVAPNSLGWKTVLVRRPDGVYADREPPAGGMPQQSVDTLAVLVEA